MVPSSDSGDDFVWVGGPGEGFGIIVGLDDEAVDGGLEVDDTSKDTALESPFGEFGEAPSTALSHEQEVGVKWKVKRGWRSSRWPTFGCLWAA